MNGMNKEKHTVRGGVMMSGKGEPWHTKEEYVSRMVSLFALLLLSLLNRYFLMASHHERAVNRPADRPATFDISKLDSFKVQSEHSEFCLMAL